MRTIAAIFFCVGFISISSSQLYAESLDFRLRHFSRHVFSTPAGERYCQIEPDGTTIIPNGRLIRPIGKQLLLEPHPYGLTVSADGQFAVTANSGTEPFSFSVIRNPFSDEPVVRDIPEGVKTDEGVLNACFMGLATAPPPNTHILYASGGDDGTVMVWDLNAYQRIKTIDLNVPFNGRDWKDGYTGDLVLSPDGKRLYVVDQMNFRVVTLDTESGQIIDVVAVGRYPFGLAMTPDGKKLFVANIGLFEYSAVEGFDPNHFIDTTLSFPATKYLSDEMKEGTVAEGIQVPGLGEPNVDEAVSVYVVELDDAGKGAVTQRIKTGVLVGEKVEDIPALGGASPNSVVTDGRFVYVTNGTNDSISVIDAETNSIVDEIKINMPAPFHLLRGVIPFGLALSDDGSRLYVAESGINAVGVIDANARRVLGHIPVGWFPSKLKLSPDGKQLIVANAKGFGAGPNGGPGVDLEGRSGIGNLMRGTASIFTIPPESELAYYTQQTIDNNVRISSERWGEVGENNPAPPYPGAYQSPIEYTVFIVKENRTYDQVFGELEGGRGELSLVDFGLNETVRSTAREGDVVEGVNVMPNHQILARRFSASDNFYCDSDHSADGHRWLQGVYPGVWTETGTTASYGGRRKGKIISTAPGRRAVTGAYAGLIPEDYIEVGTIWDHFDRWGVSFFNFGLGFEYPQSSYGDDQKKDVKYTGIQIAVNYPLPAPLFDRTSRLYATYNTNIPDQFRMDMFEKELNERWLSGNEPFPKIITMSLPNDHGAGERPEAGYPYRESYMADNDLALGRVVELLSHTPYWKKMAIFVTEDDAQNGRDHVDHHRSISLVISPYAKPGYVSHVHTSLPSILKTMNLIHGIPYINQYDAMTSDLSDMFHAKADFSPYNAVPVDKRIFDPQKALDPFDENFDWESVYEFPVMDSPEVMKKWMEEDAERRIERVDEN
ncbi:MAG: hypothetical protein P9L94_11090 [Candidatus Hinthialibacter antarcticus]|nr:hypothetical protein [Candidatus Hinthialibacter antarcticus]